ncbi:MAG: Phosphoribosyltransferase [candidate division TM6 bacterium GW2011_GWF2_32_72]|nr:MAG: Phosphoribosyltransferase [candidate division TM6 bacterium GW2011_GWF2_32_72]
MLFTFFNCLINFFKKLLSPPFCFNCKKFIEHRIVFCSTCFNGIKRVNSFRISVTQNHWMNVFAVSNYEYPVKSLILAKAWQNRLASKALGKLVWAETNLQNVEFDILIPIPLHWTRYAKRGFNQAEEMANEISKLSGKPVLNLLKRQKMTRFQFLLFKKARGQNLKNAFIATTWAKEEVEGKHVVLVDDLMTTGSTLIYAAKELVKLNPASITAVVGARVV